MNDLIYAIPSIVLVGAANTLLKWRLDKQESTIGLLAKLQLVFTDPYLLAAIVATGLSVLWWLSVISKVKVSLVYPVIQAGAIVCTVLLSTFLLGEKLIPIQYIGLIIITVGIVILSSSGS